MKTLYRLLGLLVLIGVMSFAGAPYIKAASLVRQQGKPNIILIIIDTLRADHMSAYGYSRNTTPNLDAWIADQGIRFQNVTSTASWTFPANAAMMTGYRPSSLGATWATVNSAFPGQAKPLAQHLHDDGYYTAAFVSSWFVREPFGFAKGFDVYDDVLASRPLSETVAGPLNERAFGWLEANLTQIVSNTQPLFLQLYYFDPHSWFNPPAPYDTLYDSSYTGPLTPAVFANGEAVMAGGPTPTARDLEHLLALYDGEIAYTDAQIGQMLDYLSKTHILDNALVIVTADHAEQFGEHNQWMHGNSVYEEVTRVPLLMRYTGVISPGIVTETPVQNMDLMPTILDWSGIPVPAGLDAVSLRSLAEGQAFIGTRDIFSEVDGVTDPQMIGYGIAPPSDLRAIRRANSKLIHQVNHPDNDELYILQPLSPYEVDNAAQLNPELVATLRQTLFNVFRLYRLLLPLVTRVAN